MKWTPWEDLQLDMALLLFHQRFFDIQLLVVSQLLEGPLFQSSWALIFPGFPECCMADKYTLQHVLVTPANKVLKVHTTSPSEQIFIFDANTF